MESKNNMPEQNKAFRLNDDELDKVSGGVSGWDYGIRYSDDCHYSPSRFENAFDPKVWSRTAECARCVYNSNRFWEYSVCTYEEKHRNQL